MTEAPPPAGAPSAAEAPYQRLHPSTLVYGALRGLLGLGFLLLPVLRGAEGPGARFSLVLAVVFGVLTLPGVVLAYLRFRYRLTEAEVEIRSGVVARRQRSIPVDRIQRVEVDRPLLARLFGTARVRLLTGSGAGAEGSLEYVALADALALRESVRRMQAAAEAGPALPTGEPLTGESPTGEPREAPPAEAPAAPLAFRLTPGLLLRAGAMRFSLVYIAIAFSGLQFVGFSLVDVVDWIEEADLLGRVPFLAASPLLALAVSLGVALGLSWLAGLATTALRYYGFTLRADARRLYTERGFGGRFERAIPRRKVQAVLYTSNPLTRRFGYARLEVQTMGLDAEGSGREVLLPLAPAAEASALGAELLGHGHAGGLRPVSPKFVRRRTLRYTVVGLAGVGAAWLVWSGAVWGLLAVPLAWPLARAQYRAHGYAFDGETLVVQAGALWRRQWHLPLEKLQAADRWANRFQARQGLASLAVDTAGAPASRGPTVEDLPAEEAAALAEAVVAAYFARQRAGPVSTAPGA